MVLGLTRFLLDPCEYANLTCGENQHEVYETLNETYSQCVCNCDEGTVDDGAGNCIVDTSCDATLTQCVDFAKCMNSGGLTVTGRANCVGTNCTACTDGVDCGNEYEGGDGLILQCSDPNALPANDGGPNADMSIACVCDGKTNCEWQSEDFKGELEEDCMCVTDTKCPVT